MDAYLTKPFNPAQLAAVLQSLVDNNPSLRTRTAAERIPPPQPAPVAPLPVKPTPQEVTAHLLRTTGLDPAQIEKIYAAAQMSIADTLKQAKLALAQKDRPGLIRAAHTLKGTLLQCGLDEWAGKAQAIYRGGKGNQDLPYADLLQALEQGLSRLLPAQGR
jgi:HPt (histidine-containing phosphotransfer) domain-containing protein